MLSFLEEITVCDEGNIDESAVTVFWNETLLGVANAFSNTKLQREI